MKLAIHADIWKEAIAAFESEGLSDASPDIVYAFLDGPRSWNKDEHTEDISLLCRQHLLVEWFTADLCATVRKRRFLETQVDVEVFDLTEDERLRIHMAFYRFKVYCNLFRIADPDRLELDDVRDAFFKPMPSWEVEEFACIVDYLNEKLAVLDEIACHDLAFPYRYRLAYSNGISPFYETRCSFTK